MAPSKSKLKKDGKETLVENRTKREVKGSTENEHKVAQPSSSKSPTVSKSSIVPSKRKVGASSSAPSKTARRSSRTAPESHFEPREILQLLLSPSSLPFCRPSDEIADLETRGSDLVTYSSSSFTPFEELVCAVILSRPISHTLGLRSIRTLFNKPYELRSPRVMREAGVEGRRKALDQARTQHKQKTAEELGNLVDVGLRFIGDGDEDVNLERVRRDAGENADKEREILKKAIKGLGKTGLDIFFRRIQGEWKEVYPFVDHKTSGGLKNLGLPDNAEGLRNLLDESWKNLTTVDIAAEDDQGKRRKAFVRILERAVGADLEKNIDKIRAEAGNSVRVRS